MRLIQTNIFNTIKILNFCSTPSLKKYFCVSTDKAANPVNLMGASKRIMEMYLMKESLSHNISMARFANVAFSDGSLLHGFNQRLAKRQPISAPNDVMRYFVTPKESGELCLLSALLGENRDIFFPKLSPDMHLETFSAIAKRYLLTLGFEPHECASEQEARDTIDSLVDQKKWPVYFFQSDTTGEKDFEEFYTAKENLDLNRFFEIGVISNSPTYNAELLSKFETSVAAMITNGMWNKIEIIDLFNELIPDFDHKETGKYLDNRM
jgi:FlaA1/EpsC-like NDP-sugar epimerase